MSHLAEYVARIYNEKSNHEKNDNQKSNDQIKIENVILQCEKNYEQDIEITQTTKIYTFSDGTQLKQSIEQDNQLFEVESCLESWIEYQVIQQSNANIQPQKIHFDKVPDRLHPPDLQ